MMKDFIAIDDFDAAQLDGLLERAGRDKALHRAGRLPRTLQEKTLAMIFEKPSLRTRVSFETAMTQLGGHAIYLTHGDIQLGAREPVQDAARVLGRICDGIMARTFSHEVVEQLAEHSPTPVINALTDHSHPCQAMADLMTVRGHFGVLAGKKLAFVGDGNNVARSLAAACRKLDMKFVLACPEGYELGPDADRPRKSAETDQPAPAITHDPHEAVARADVIYTDTWVSMGQEEHKQERLAAFEGFQVNAELLGSAPAGAIVMHCLPAYRGLEITDESFEAHAETIFEQSENRLHFQRTLLNVLMAEGGVE